MEFDRLEDRTAPATGSIQGTLWNDTNASQVRDAGEAVLAGRTVYLDLDRDGRLDAAEPTAVTAADGSYGFTGLAPGPYHVAQVIPDGWQQTAPGTYPTRSVLLQETSQRDQFNFDALGRTTSYTLSDPYTEAGYTIDTTAENVSKFRVYGSTDTARYGGSPALTISNWPTTISIRRDDGAPFSIRSIDLAETWSSVYIPTVIFKGTKADGRVVQQSFQLDNIFNNTNAFQTFTFVGFDDVVSVDWFTHDSNDAHQFDDVVVEAGGSLNAVGVDLGSRAQATPGLTVRDYSVFEQNGGAYYVFFYVDLDTANTLPVNVYYSTEGGGTAGGAGQDYLARSGRFVFQPGETSRYVAIRTYPDTVPEADETIKVDVWGAVNARILDNQAVITLYNDDLTAVADTYTTNQNVVLDVAGPGVLANDGNASPVATAIVSTPSHGTLSFAADGSFRYTPGANYVGSDSFSYRTQRTISGLYGTQDSFTTNGPTAVVNLTIQAVNAPPTANADAYTVAEDGALVVPAPQGPVLRYGFDEASSGTGTALDSGTAPPANASLLTGATRTASTPGGATRGALDLTAENAYINVAAPAADVEKIDALPAMTVTLWVNLRGTPTEDDILVNDIPGLSGASVGEGGWQLKLVSPLSGSLSASNFAFQFDIFEKDGTGSGHSNGIISTAIDGNQKWVFVAVTVDPSRFVRTYRGIEGFTSGITAMGTLSSQIPLLNNRVPLRVGGSSAFPNSDATPPAWIDDVRIYNRALSASELETVRQQGFTRAVGVTANDSDPNNDPLTAVVVTNPTNGSLTFFPDGTFHYLPNPNFNGTDSFTYKLSDGTLESAPATVTITVTPVNDAPTGAVDIYATVEDTPLTIAAPGVLGNDSDIDGDALTATIAVAPVAGTIVLNPNGSFTYTPTLNYYTYTGTVPAYDTFFYRVSDGTAQSNLIPIRISISPVNDPPLAADDTGVVLEDNGPLAIDVLANDSFQLDPGEILSVVGVTQPAHGIVSFTGTGVLYTPAANYNGTDTFTYTVTDGNGGSATATVVVSVLAGNDAPTAVDDAYSLDEETTLAVSAAQGVLINDSDIDGDTMMADVVAQPEHGTLAFGNDGSFFYTPFQNFAGVDSFSYSTRDFNGGTSAVAVVHLTVRQLNDPPTGVANAYAIRGDTVLVIAAPGVLGNDTDIDGDVLTAVLYSGPGNGTLDLKADGSFTYRPAAGFQGQDYFTYRAVDPSGSFAYANVEIKVLPANVGSFVTFAETDSTTQGNWKGVFGKQGYHLAQDTSAGNPSIPSYATVTMRGQYGYTWEASTSAVAALQKSTGTLTDRLAATWFANSFEFDVRLNDGQAHQIALYAIDWEHASRGETVELIDTASGSVHDTRSLSNFGNGVYLVWNVEGNFTIRVTRTAGTNAVISGLFFDRAATPTTVTPLASDTTTQGNWKNVYGRDGYHLAQDTSAGNPSIPSYATVTMRGQYGYTWEASTSDVAALQKSTGTLTDRLAATWFANSFEFDVRLNDGQAHQIALYALDWGGSRSETVQLIDTVSGAVLDTRSLSNFGSGVYLVWNVTGRVTIKVTKTAGTNAVLSGLFFDPVTPPATVTPLASDTTTQGNWKNVYGRDGYHLAQDTSAGNPNIPSYATVTMRGQYGYTWEASTSDVAALQKSTGTLTDRLAATWFANSFEFDVRLNDGQAHQIALYALDWGGSRSETVQLIDTVSGAVLDTRSLSNFGSGVYLVWNVTGRVTIKVSKTAGMNAVISGLFFG